MGTDPTSPRVTLFGDRASNRSPKQHAFTVDVEDWYQGIPIDERLKRAAAGRLTQGLDRLLAIMEEHDVLGTFFWLGPAAERYPDLVRRVAEAGHEIGSHGWSHDLLYSMSPARFREETQRSLDVIASLSGVPVTAYRAAYFSITESSLWALEILAELGVRYDSSIFPVRNWRYGIPDFNPRPQHVTTPAGPIYEHPISVRRMLGQNVPVSGGAYFRIYPYGVTRSNFRAAERAGRPVVFYLHPWELDPDHPHVPFHWKPRFTHYVRLASTEPKLRQLLRDFSFGSLGTVLQREAGGP